MKRLLVTFIIIIIVLSACSSKGDDNSGITLVNAVMPAMPPGQTMATIYFRLDNDSGQDLVVNHVQTPIADHIEVHRNFYEDGMMKMREVSHLRIAAGSRLLFEPGGYHLMVFGISEPLRSGDQFPLTIEFEGGFSVETVVEVQALSL